MASDVRKTAPASIQRLLVSDHLDLIRGLAALAVLIFHVRYSFFLNYQDVSDRSPLSIAFYTLTAFGHDAVMIFFVLSGYFISASVFRDHAADRWSWRRYFVNRFSRLYIVLLPALLLTLFWDSLGLRFFPEHPIYTGEQRPWIHDYGNVAARFDLRTFLGNAAFLQSIKTPPFGSNYPLWSLSFEWWYYVLFPLAWFAFVRRAGWVRTSIQLAVVALLLIFVEEEVVLYFPIWLLGTAVCLAPKLRFLQGVQSPIASLVAGGLFFAIMTATHIKGLKRLLFNSSLALDYVNGITFALLLYFLLHNQAGGASGLYSRVSKFVANFSYTLYAVHMPILVFGRAALLPDRPWTPDLPHVALGLGIALTCILYAFLISRVTEAKTDQLRGLLTRWIGPGSTKPL